MLCLKEKYMMVFISSTVQFSHSEKLRNISFPQNPKIDIKLPYNTSTGLGIETLEVLIEQLGVQNITMLA